MPRAQALIRAARAREFTADVSPFVRLRRGQWYLSRKRHFWIYVSAIFRSWAVVGWDDSFEAIKIRCPSPSPPLSLSLSFSVCVNTRDTRCTLLVVSLPTRDCTRRQGTEFRRVESSEETNGNASSREGETNFRCVSTSSSLRKEIIN